MKRIGKIGRANILANKRIREIVADKQIYRCELMLDEECMHNWPLAPAHRHKRSWYRGNSEKLSDFSQWVIACQVCHNKIEIDPELTERMFLKLRGVENDA